MTEPLVGIGIPVYNGVRRLPATLDSILAQSLTDFEVLISDNGSTDGTPALCAEYAARDPRIRYIRQPENRGLPFNWNYVARNTRGRYFKWASSNDLLAPEMLRSCVDALDADPLAVLAYGRTGLVGADGESLGEYRGDIPIPDAAPSARFLAAHHIAMNNAVNGVMRRRALLGSRLIRPYPASDYVLMAELALHGTFLLLPQILFYRRTGPGSMTTGLRRIDSLRLHDPAATGHETIALRRYMDLMGVALTVGEFSLRERLKVVATAARLTIWARNKIAADLVEALRGERDAVSAG